MLGLACPAKNAVTRAQAAADIAVFIMPPFFTLVEKYLFAHIGDRQSETFAFMFLKCVRLLLCTHGIFFDAY